MCFKEEVLRQVDPGFLTGFTDADGCFYVHVDERSKQRRIKPMFCLTQQSPPGAGASPLLQACREYFGVGHFARDKRSNCYTLRINSLKQLCDLVIPHFEAHPLYSEKRRDFAIFCKICSCLREGHHRSTSGWQDVRELAYSMNRTSSRNKLHRNKAQEAEFKRDSQNPRDLQFSFHLEKEFLSQALLFGKMESQALLKSSKPSSMSGEYVSGLCQGDGTFTMCFEKKRIKPAFALGQHNLSLELLYGLVKYFSCGKVVRVSPTYSRYNCAGLADLEERILTHFEIYPLWDEKALHLEAFQRGCTLLRLGGHKKILELVDCVYDSNKGGKRRRLSREEYLKVALGEDIV